MSQKATSAPWCRISLWISVLVAIAAILFYFVVLAESLFAHPHCAHANKSDKITWLQDQEEDATFYPYKSDGMTILRTFIAMRDAVQIAANVYLPTRAIREKHKLPTIMHGTRYYRALKTKFPFSVLLGKEFDPRVEQIISPIVSRGYAYVIFDVRGTGWSTGFRRHDMSEEEIADLKQVMDWTLQQEWCNGNLGSFGLSYEGMVAEAMLSLDDKGAMKAIAPMFTPFDTFRDVSHPGGIFNMAFFEHYETFVTIMERMQQHTSETAASPLVWFGFNYVLDGPSPVDDSSITREQIIADHEKNWKPVNSLKDLKYIDAPLSWLSNKTVEQIDTERMLKVANRKDVGLLTLSSWYDGSFISSTLNRFHSYKTVNKKLLIGSWNHGGEQNASPFSDTRRSCFEFSRELIRFFDYHLKPEVADKNYYNEPAVRYFTLGEDKWQSDSSWPPALSASKTYYLHANGKLSNAPAVEAKFANYQVNFTQGSSKLSRWALIQQLSVKSLVYDTFNLTGMLSYVSEPASQAMEITGNPTAQVSIRVNKPDGFIFAYLLSIDENSKLHYITEGHVRLIHRKVYTQSLVSDLHIFRSYRESDAQLMPTDEFTPVNVFLQPISYLLPKGHRLVVAFAGYDALNFDVSYKQELATEWSVSDQSFVQIPIKE